MTKKRRAKETTSYKRMGLVMLFSAIGGAVLGIVSAIILGDNAVNSIESGAAFVLAGIQRIMVPVLTAVTIVTIIYGEINLRKQKMLFGKILESEDEECDRWEYEEEKVSAYGTVVNLLSQIVCILVLSAGYSIKYIGGGNSANMLAACLIFLGCYAYDGFWQARFVKVVQTAHPEKKGDLSSRKFHQQWLDSCDEAEKEVIYRSAYESYRQAGRVIPILLIVTMLGHLFFDTGIMAIIIVAVIWLVITVAYLSSCVSLKKNKIRE